jgi:hypothetical protein
MMRIRSFHTILTGKYISFMMVMAPSSKTQESEKRSKLYRKLKRMDSALSVESRVVRTATIPYAGNAGQLSWQLQRRIGRKKERERNARIAPSPPL